MNKKDLVTISRLHTTITQLTRRSDVEQGNKCYETRRFSVFFNFASGALVRGSIKIYDFGFGFHKIFLRYTLSTPHIISPYQAVLRIVIQYSIGSSRLNNVL